MSRLMLINALVLAAGLAGCAVGPDYHRADALPAQSLPQTFSDNNPTNATLWKLAGPVANQSRGPWWERFGDAGLDRLESLAQTNNQDLAAAAARLEQSRLLVTAVRSSLYPQLSAGGTPNGDLTRTRTSINQPVQGKAAGTAYTFSTFTAPVYLGWEIDLWGRVRHQTQAARARFHASVDDYEAARLAVAAEVADDYFTLQALANEYAAVTNSIAAYRRSLELTQNRRRGGLVSDLDVAQAATQLHAAEARLPDLELSRAETLHALAVLCGQSPAGFDVTPASSPAGLAAIPASLPSELLERRPDIAAAERRMAAANADIGVARAAFFPTVKINGLAGFQSIDTSSWFGWPSRFWAVGPSVQLPLFTGGLNRANYAITQAAYAETVAGYRQTVLTAFGQVEDALAAQRLLAEEWDAENAALQAARHTLEIVNNRYRAGLVTYLDVSTAQTDALNYERSTVQLAGARWIATVNLIKALGGGWQSAPE